MSATSIDRASERRRRQLAAIHVLATKRLRLDRETYIALLERVGGVRSSADLDSSGLSRVLDEMRRLAGEGQRQMRNAVNLADAPQNVRDEVAAIPVVLLDGQPVAEAALQFIPCRGRQAAEFDGGAVGANGVHPDCLLWRVDSDETIEIW